MKRLFTILASLMLMVSTSSAQQNFYFWDGGGISNTPVSQVDSITFSSGSWVFQFKKPECNVVSTNYFEGILKVSLNEKVKNLETFSVFPEIGICFSDEDSTPTYTDSRKKALGNAMKEYSFTLSDLLSGTTYYYRTYVKLMNEAYYSEVNSITTYGEKPERPQNVIINGHKFVDLGLPSGILWACTNIGASSLSEEGDYFAWGEIETKNKYSWDTYKWGTKDDLCKYNFSDEKVSLDSDDDAATIQWGTPCCMPSIKDFDELCRNCKWSWDGNGYLVIGTNGNYVYFPASGLRENEDQIHDSSVLCWSRSSLHGLGLGNAYCLYIGCTGDFHIGHDYFYRYYGLPIRPVVKK